MQRKLTQFLALLLTTGFVAFAASALAAPTDVGKGTAQQQKVDKAYCEQHPTDPRCKDVK
jgi:hypothetical protein